MATALFQLHFNYSTGFASAPNMVAVGDFNNDHRLDIAVANYGTNNVGIFFGFGKWIFRRPNRTFNCNISSNRDSLS